MPFIEALSKKPLAFTRFYFCMTVCLASACLPLGAVHRLRQHIRLELVDQTNANLVRRPYLVKVLTRLNMDFVKSYFGKNEPSRSVLIWKKTGDKSVQLVRGSFLSKYFLQNPYFSWLFKKLQNRANGIFPNFCPCR